MTLMFSLFLFSSCVGKLCQYEVMSIIFVFNIPNWNKTGTIPIKMHHLMSSREKTEEQLGLLLDGC